MPDAVTCIGTGMFVSSGIVRANSFMLQNLVRLQWHRSCQLVHATESRSVLEKGEASLAVMQLVPARYRHMVAYMICRYL
jgi:hypothetical protein